MHHTQMHVDDQGCEQVHPQQLYTHCLHLALSPTIFCPHNMDTVVSRPARFPSIRHFYQNSLVIV